MGRRSGTSRCEKESEDAGEEEEEAEEEGGGGGGGFARRDAAIAGRNK